MTDIIERAEAALKDVAEFPWDDFDFRGMTTELVAELKATRAENAALREQQYGFGSMYSGGSDV